MLKVDPVQKVILVQEDGTRWYIVYDQDGNAHTYHNVSIFGEHGFHARSTSEYSSTCEFLADARCNYDGRTTGRIDDEDQIFAMLISNIDR